MFSGRGRGEDVRGRALPDLRLERVRAGEVVALVGIERSEHLRERGRRVDRQRRRLVRARGRGAGEERHDGEERRRGSGPSTAHVASFASAEVALDRRAGGFEVEAVGNELPTAVRPRATRASSAARRGWRQRLAKRTRTASVGLVAAAVRYAPRRASTIVSPAAEAAFRVRKVAVRPRELEVLRRGRRLRRVGQQRRQRRHVLRGGEAGSPERRVEGAAVQLRRPQPLRSSRRGAARSRRRSWRTRARRRSPRRRYAGTRDARERETACGRRDEQPSPVEHRRRRCHRSTITEVDLTTPAALIPALRARARRPTRASRSRRRATAR